MICLVLMMGYNGPGNNVKQVLDIDRA